ncbi:16S rRNA (uracil1498-N3)-methyltransferase [Desulfobaculum xiamenense]|uniref:Ribosomal RNA small subunit methyltransferase E n=1 Tax=Desulfobaculum xiamenense TaxID=995050 RepID=A0A846QNI5_9BACT|nr:16S rRNA (uracil(1498)-N(3))-methyltransferase [Desulfobaculum xiamenense]NJB66784.1 16S rRNA (uracil1498-N3)-methyltransferase [Desulfobaculum xiamenense]
MKTFYLEPDDWREPYMLSGPEAHHLSRVLRLKPGETVRLFDGRGRTGTFEILSCSKSNVMLAAQDIADALPPANPITLALGWAKGIRRGWLLEKAVELQAEGLLFWQAKRSQGHVPDDSKETWDAKLIAGAKQCGSAFLPNIGVCPGGVRELVEIGKDYDHRFVLWESPDCPAMLDFPALTRPGRVLCVLGPEGGFAPGEAEELIAGGFTAVSLGNSILRWETAALIALGLFWWGRQHADES